MIAMEKREFNKLKKSIRQAIEMEKKCSKKKTVEKREFNGEMVEVIRMDGESV